MKKTGRNAQVAIAPAHRRVLRETRERVGFTQAALEKKARVGKTYVWYVETGTTRSTAVGPLTRVVTTLQKEAMRADVPARLKAGLQRLLKDVGKQAHGR
jgi:predicted transcriptional regulator